MDADVDGLASKDITDIVQAKEVVAIDADAAGRRGMEGRPRQLEHLPEGWGIVFDDVAAGLYAWGVAALLRLWI